MDRSEGYDGIAAQFMAVRSDVDAAFVRSWARETLPRGASVVDIGCGSGVPITQALVDDGFDVFGIDASPAMIAAFRRGFPDAQSACAAAQDSAVFDRPFDAAVAIGLLFLLSPEDQERVIDRIAGALRAGGRFLFTAPREACAWPDILTGRLSRSLGETAYRRILKAAGFSVVACYQRENHFFDSVKPLC